MSKTILSILFIVVISAGLYFGPPYLIVQEIQPLLSLSLILSMSASLFWLLGLRLGFDLSTRSILFGAFLWSYCWTVGSSYFLYAGTISLLLPLLTARFYMWGVAGLVTGHLFLWTDREAAKHESEVNQTIDRQALQAGFWIVPIIFTFWIFTTLLNPYAQQNPAFPYQQKGFTFPAGYQGVAVVIFDQAAGEGPVFVDGVRIYEIRETGILADQGPSPGFVGNDEFWYVDEQGVRLEQIPMLGTCSSGFLDDYRNDVVIVCLRGGATLMQGLDIPDYYGFTVGPVSEQKDLGKDFDIWFRDLVNERFWIE